MDFLAVLLALQLRLVARDGDTRSDHLLAAVLADPDADEPRMVYGDHLLEHGDSRGEFIQLQLAHARSPDRDEARSQRIREIARDRLADWCAPLFPALDASSVEFERGFLWRCRALDGTRALFDVLGHPTWHTVGDLETTDEPLMRDACLRSLRTLRTSLEGMAAMVGVDRENRIARVVLRNTVLRDPSRMQGPNSREEAAWARIQGIGALGNVRTLVVEGEIDSYSRQARSLLASPFGRQLDTLEYWDERSRPAPWLTLLADHPLRRLVVHLGGRARIAFERNDRGKLQPVVELDGHGKHDEVLDAALSLVSSCRRIEVSIGEDRDELEPIVSELRACFDNLVIRGD